MSSDTKQVNFLYKIRRRGGWSKWWRFLMNFLELQIPMVLGALVCYVLGRLVPTTSSFGAVYHPGTFLFMIGDVLYLSIPVVIWMRFRQHSWRYSLEMASAMIAPVAAITMVGQLSAYDYLMWLVTGMYPAMCLGILGYMLYRRDYFIRQSAI